jgi:Ca-activated chloride channel family protein
MRPDLRVGTTLVEIPVTVTDAWNRPVMNLPAGSFRIYEDGVEQPIHSISTEDTPVEVCILADVSASMGGKRTLLRAALEQFLHLANDDDRYCLIEFNEHSRLVTDLPSSAAEVLANASWTHTSGQTALFDAVHDGLARMRNVQAARKALLIVSDGGDNRSRYTDTDIRCAVREADVRVYAMGLVDPVHTRRSIPELERGPDLLRTLAEESGGHAYLVERRAELADAAQAIGLALRSRYLLHYKPAKDRHDGRYHEVVVKVAPTLHASWRHGYYAPE